MGHFIPPVSDTLDSKAHRKIVQVKTSNCSFCLFRQRIQAGFLVTALLFKQSNANKCFPSIPGNTEALLKLVVLFLFSLNLLLFPNDGFVSDTCAS